MVKAITLESLRPFFVDNFAVMHHIRFFDVVCAIGASYAILKVIQTARRRSKTTALRGPPSPSFLWGVSREILSAEDFEPRIEKWAEEYGGVYEIPVALGGRRTILCDPKAIAHCFAGEPWTYILTPFGKVATEKMLGKGILSAVGENHRRIRKILTPAFGNAAIRNLTPVFYNSAYKAQGIWDGLIESSGGGSTIIDVQNWMNHISLDTIGIAGFSHDFGALDGKPTFVTEVFDNLSKAVESTLSKFILIVAEDFPWLLRMPLPYMTASSKMNDTMAEASDALLTKSRKEKEAGTLGEGEQKSILGLLIGAESQEGQIHLTREEVMSQAKVLLVAGYETTSVSLTWALIELSRNLDIQCKLREELLAFGADPTYDQLSTNLPYLDAVVHETLRIHPPLGHVIRTAAIDDVIPLSKPVRTRSGELVDHISVAKGTLLTLPMQFMNRSMAFWGPDSNEFNPERWIKEGGIPAAAKEIQGHRHMLTFIDGPRTCLGKGFAIAEFKIVLSVLVKHFAFELPGGPETVIESVMGILLRPKVAGEEGAAVPLRVRRFE